MRERKENNQHTQEKEHENKIEKERD